MVTKLHKQSGWRRIHEGRDIWRIESTDGSPIRRVVMLSQHTYQGHPGDTPEAAQRGARVLLIEGPILPDWAVAWLESANVAQHERARSALRRMIDQADSDQWDRWGEGY